MPSWNDSSTKSIPICYTILAADTFQADVVEMTTRSFEIVHTLVTYAPRSFVNERLFDWEATLY